MAGGRPSKYTKALGEKICKQLAEGKSLKKIGEASDMPSRITIHSWLFDENKKEFLIKYNTAINVRTENMFDELNDIADDGTNDFIERKSKDGESFTVQNPEVVARSRLRVDTRKWYLSKVMPKKYGDKLDLTSKGEKIKTNTIIVKDFSDGTDSESQV